MATKTATIELIRVVHTCGRALHYDPARQQFLDNGRVERKCPCCWQLLVLSQCRDLEGIPIGNR